MSDSEKKDVVVSSSWFGNLFIVAVVVAILGAAVLYKEYFG